MGRVEAARGMGAPRGMAAAGGPRNGRATRRGGRIRADRARDGQAERREGATAVDEARVEGGSEHHGQKRRGEVWRVAS